MPQTIIPISPKRNKRKSGSRMRRPRLEALENRRVLASLGVDIGFFTESNVEIRDSVLRGEIVSVRVDIQDIRQTGQGNPAGVIALPVDSSWNNSELQATRTFENLNPLPIDDVLVTNQFPIQRGAGSLTTNGTGDSVLPNVRGAALPNLGLGQAIGATTPETFSEIPFQAFANSAETSFTVSLAGSMSFADAAVLDDVIGLDRTVDVQATPNTVRASIAIVGGSISGTKFDDLNGNGTRDAGEPGLAGVTIRLDPDAIGLPNQEIQTDADGSYVFGDLAKDGYTIIEIVPDGSVLTSPTNPFLVTLDQGNQNVTDIDFGNFQLITVSGTKFNDVDDLGVRNAGETGRTGVTINLDLDSDGSVDRTIDTGVDGSYQFAEVGPGTHRIFETVPDDSTQTFPAGGDYSIATVSGQNVADLDFGNRINPTPTTSVSGTKFDDLNGNGVRDVGEPGKAGITIMLDLANDSEPERSTITDANGEFRFDNVVAGNYSVSEMLPARTIQTTPGTPFSIDVNPPGEITGLTFGNFELTTLSGVTFEDLDGDGFQDTGERPLGGVTVNLDLLNDGSVDLVILSNAQGRYEFTDVAPGTHRIAQEVIPTFEPTLPNPAERVIANVSGLDRDQLDFGNRIIEVAELDGSISGSIYSDTDFDGVLDANEFGLPGVTVQLIAPGGAVTQTVTSASGTYRFDDLEAGTYRVVEIQPTGFSDASITLGTVLPGGQTIGVTDGFNAFNGIAIGDNEVAIDYNFGEVLTAVTKRMFLASANLRGELANNVTPTEFRINGTAGDDVIVVENLDAGGLRVVVNNRPSVILTAAQAPLVMIDGLGGMDRVDYIGSSQDERIEASPSQLSITTSGQSLGVFNVEDIRVDGITGDDRAVLRDSAGDDQLNARDNLIVLLSSDDRRIGLANIDQVQAVSAIDNGNDTTNIESIDFVLQLAGDWQSA